MTYFQMKFIENLRFWRKKRGLSQLKLSEMVNISPNYLNAVENGKNFPSPEIIQQISDTLGILPYQLFIEHPSEVTPVNTMVSELLVVKQRLVKEIDTLIQKY
jgi:transcriptional regulator with XRE-family HTH domain